MLFRKTDTLWLQQQKFSYPYGSGGDFYSSALCLDSDANRFSQSTGLALLRK